MVIPIPDKKITSAVWGPCEEYIITGHEDGEICHYDFKVCFLKMFTASVM
jgi:translation initiation factor 3 subunit I